MPTYSPLSQVVYVSVAEVQFILVYFLSCILHCPSNLFCNPTRSPKQRAGNHRSTQMKMRELSLNADNSRQCVRMVSRPLVSFLVPDTLAFLAVISTKIFEPFYDLHECMYTYTCAKPAPHWRTHTCTPRALTHAS